MDGYGAGRDLATIIIAKHHVQVADTLSLEVRDRLKKAYRDAEVLAPEASLGPQNQN